jgi:hypothetical protein
MPMVGLLQPEPLYNSKASEYTRDHFKVLEEGGEALAGKTKVDREYYTNY